MRTRTALLLIPLLGAACAPAARVDSTPPMGAGLLQADAHVPAGAWLTVRIDQPVGQSTTEATDHQFTATVLEPVLAASGELLIPRDAKLEGVVTTFLDGDGRHPQLVGVKFDRLTVGPASFDIDTAVTEVDLGMAHANGEGFGTVDPSAPLASHQASIPGTIIEDAESFFKEDELGNDPGTVISLGWDSGFHLPKESRMTVELLSDVPMQVVPSTGR